MMMSLSVMIASRVVMIVFEKKSADEIYSQRQASNPDRLVEMNLEMNEEPVDGFAGHQQRDH